MKQRALFFICLACVFLIFSCKGKEKPSITAKLVTEGSGINDRSYNAAAWEGVLSFYGDVRGEEEGFGVCYDIVPCRETAQMVSVLKQVATDAPDLIITTGFVFQSALSFVAPIFPDQKFLNIDSTVDEASNVLSFLFAAEEGSFLVGVAAALQSIADGVANPSFGFIGGIPGDIILDFEVGYIQGIRHVLPDAPIYEYYAGDWTKPELAAAIAKEWYDEKNVYAIYSAAGATGNGTIAQAVAHRKLGKNVWAIGVDRDQFEEGSYGVGKSAVLTSMVKKVDQAVKYGLSQVQKNTFAGGTVVLGLKQGAVGYTVTNEDFNADVKKQMTGIMANIIAENIKVAGVQTDRAKVLDIVSTIKGEM